LRALAEARVLAEREAFLSVDAICRQIIAPHLPDYEKTIGLTAPDDQFRWRVTQAIIACVFQHMLTPYLPRASGLSKDLAKARDQAQSAQNSLRRLADILDGLPQTLSDQLTTHWGILGEIRHRSLEREISWLEQVSVIMSMYAERLKTLDRGGAPKMRAFEVLAKGLADAYEAATGRQAGVTWDDYGQKYDGEFLKLVEAVLPLAAKLADMPQRPLRVPVQGKYALGKYLSTLTTARRKKRSRL
jgi:hypothetical protein